MKNILFLIFIFCGCATVDLQGHDLFAYNVENLSYQTKYGMLHGNFTQDYPNGKRMAEGQFESNQRVGTWNFYNYNGDLIEKRLYFNNYEYAIMRNGEKIWRQFNTNGTWDLIRSKDVKFKKRLWKKVERGNAGHLDIDRLVNAVNNSKTGDFYADERFVNEVDKPKLGNITAVKIKEDCIYDNKREAMFVRTLGIGFVDNNNRTVAWIHYPDWKETFKQVKSYWHNDNLNMQTLLDVFELRAYEAVPYKSSNEEDNDKSVIDIELEMIHMENMFIIAKA